MKTQVIIFSANHYEMDGNKGLSVRVLGEFSETNNKFGVEISEATVPNYEELSYLKKYGQQLPALFNCSLSLSAIKANNGKERTGVTLKNLEFAYPMELVEKKTVKAN